MVGFVRNCQTVIQTTFFKIKGTSPRQATLLRKVKHNIDIQLRIPQQ
jgi:hypothetical protein